MCGLNFLSTSEVEHVKYLTDMGLKYRVRVGIQGICFDILSNYHLFHKLKSIENCKFNYLFNILPNKKKFIECR